MEDVKKNIEQIFNQFMQEELGNRLSQFAMLSLKSMILSELKKLEEKKDGGTNIG
jgi:hypothetical protein